MAKALHPGHKLACATAGVAIVAGRVEILPWSHHVSATTGKVPHPGKGENEMADVTIVYWRDMPAQVIVGKGRRGVKMPLPERFEQAIDRAAMKSGAAESDAYLEGFRKAAPYPVDGADADVAAAEAARIDAEYDQERLKALIANDGRA